MNGFIHLPNAKLSVGDSGFKPLGEFSEIEVARDEAPWVVFAEAMPSRAERTYRIDLSTEFISPELMAMLFGDPGGLQPYAGVTITTGPAPNPTLADYAWAALAARVRYELALAAAQVDKLWRSCYGSDCNA